MTLLKNYCLSLILLLFTGFFFQSNAQDIDLSVDYGYQFGTKLNYGSNYLKASDGAYLTATIGFETRGDVMAELTYKRMDTELLIRDFVISPNEQRLADLTMDWIQVGATNYFDTGDAITPFFGGTAGVVILSPKNENTAITTRSLNSTTEFAFTFKGGMIIELSDVVGIKIQGDLMFPVSWGGVYVGGGPGGVGGGVTVSSTTIMGGLSGGLVFSFN
jgi:hypothetical protein